MIDFTLTIVDTSSIQDYVFGSNNLRQNVGASYLVDCATRKWAFQSIPCRHNVDATSEKIKFTKEHIEDEGAQIGAEVAYAGGGNTVIIFRNGCDAKKFAHDLSRKVLLEAPGLRIVITHKTFKWEKDALGSKQGVLQTAMSDLAARKTSPRLTVGLAGLGVTAECVFTGSPAVGNDKDGRPVSAEAQAKFKAEKLAFDRLLDLIDFGEFRNPPRDFDDLGARKSEKSFLAVIHADGNGMGKRVEKIRDIPQHASPGNGNRLYINALRDFSASIETAAQIALQQTVDMLIRNIDDDSHKIRDVITIKNNRLPFRPIVFGGDDVTFVCDGRIGLSLAKYYLTQYASQTLRDGSYGADLSKGLSEGEKAHCRAGVSIVHTHFPFARAYELAEDLCSSAKKILKPLENEEADPGNKIPKPPENKFGRCAIDWHIASSGILYSLDEIRLREYTVDDGSLQMRPLRIAASDKLLPGEAEKLSWRTWDNFLHVVTKFQSGSDWAGHHNKVKALRESLRGGEKEVHNFLALFGKPIELPEIVNWPDTSQKAWVDHTCGYFDAVEAVDLFVPLSESVKGIPND
jgi:hypothetical protein